MKYIIKENRMVDFVDKYLDDSVGKLHKVPYDNINASDDDFELVDDNGNVFFRYFDNELGVEDFLFIRMISLFNMKHRELEKLMKKWFSTHYLDNEVIGVHPIIE